MASQAIRRRSPGILEAMLEGFYLVVLIGAFVVISLMSVFIVYKLFAGQE